MIRVFEKQLNMIFYTSNGDSNMYSWWSLGLYVTKWNVMGSNTVCERSKWNSIFDGIK